MLILLTGADFLAINMIKLILRHNLGSSYDEVRIVFDRRFLIVWPDSWFPSPFVPVCIRGE